MTSAAAAARLPATPAAPAMRSARIPSSPSAHEWRDAPVWLHCSRSSSSARISQLPPVRISTLTTGESSAAIRTMQAARPSARTASPTGPEAVAPRAAEAIRRRARGEPFAASGSG